MRSRASHLASAAAFATESVMERSPQARGAKASAGLVAFANRLPVLRSRRGGWQTSDGGLVAALRPALERRRSRWVGWDGGSRDVPLILPGLTTELIPVHLKRRQVSGYYHGFANRTLWPLWHGLADRAVFDRSWWRDYRYVNEVFADTGLVTAPPDALLWVHDYHLALVPDLLRRQGAVQPIGFFLHIPFPAPELFARLPWRDQLIDGLLGADVVSFQTEEYRENFVRSCLRLRDDVTLSGRRLGLSHARSVTTVAHGASVDLHGLRREALSRPVASAVGRLRQQFAGRRVLVGVDRLDYTKGIVERLRAIELLLEQRRELRDRIAFVQIAVPSRGEIREYRELRSHVEELVGRINGRFTSPGRDVPVHYLHRGVPRTRLLAYYLLADVCLVTPLRDGMNLVAKEFVACQSATEGSGVLVLSEFAGAAEELREALPSNPFDVEGLAGVIELALELEEEDRQDRIQRLAGRIGERDVVWWLESQLASIARSAERRTVAAA
jgi:alpha,alpha-trehalose-phosphate synthase [UDP-forming]